MDPTALVTGDATIHVDLPPAALSDPAAGVASALTSRLLRWCPDLGGILLSYGDVELVRGNNDINRTSTSSDGSSAAAATKGGGKGKSESSSEKGSSSDDGKFVVAAGSSSSSAEISDYFAFVRVAALVRRALVFAPTAPMRLEGTVARVGGDYVGVLALGVFSAAIGGSALSNRYELSDVEVEVGVESGEKEDEGETEASAAPAASKKATAAPKRKKKKTKAWVLKSDRSQRLVEGTRVLFDVARVRRSDGGFVSILGSLDADGTGVVGASGVGGGISGDVVGSGGSVALKSKKKEKKKERSESSPLPATDAAADADAVPHEKPSSKRTKTISSSKGDEKKKKEKEKEKEAKKNKKAKK